MHFRRRYFPERRYKLPLRWVLWGLVALLFFIFAAVMRFFFR
jgi:hypothetical protein